MSKVLDATCQGEQVTCEGVPVPVAEILSEGVGQSSGVLVIEKESAWYVAKTSPDLKTTLENLITALNDCKSAIDTIATSITSLDTRGYLVSADNGVAGQPALESAVISIQSKATALEATKTQLETLKGSLK